MAFRGKSPRNRSLERGLQILRIFRPGSSLRGNNEIAEQTGLPRSTVSRLTQTLASCRFLEHDPVANAYRLGAPVLSLAEAFTVASDVLPLAKPLMKHLAGKLYINLSLAVGDGDEMVYLHAERRNLGGIPRHVTIGHRIPVESTSLGRAYLSTLDSKEREQLLATVRGKHQSRWKNIRSEIENSIRQIQREGYCQVNWLPGVSSIATAVQLPNPPVYLINMSVTTAQWSEARIRNELAPELLRLAATLRENLLTKVAKS